MRHSFTKFICHLSLAMAVVGTVGAAEPAAPSLPAAKAFAAAGAALPTCLQSLDLSAAQQEEIKAIVGDYEVDLTSVWQQFGERYGAAIRAEAMLLSAIEDNLTEPQRKQVREQRRRVAKHEMKHAGTNDKPNQAISKPVSAVEQELAIVGVSLTPEQESAADRVEEKYVSRLRSLNRDIQGLHTRLVSLEADKFVEIEKVLTPEQLKQLCEIRQTAPPVDAIEADPSK